MDDKQTKLYYPCLNIKDESNSFWLCSRKAYEKEEVDDYFNGMSYKVDQKLMVEKKGWFGLSSDLPGRWIDRFWVSDLIFSHKLFNSIRLTGIKIEK